MPEQSWAELTRLGVPVDTTPYTLSDEETVTHLARIIPHYDAVVACQAVPYVHPAMPRLSRRHSPRLSSASLQASLVSRASSRPVCLVSRAPPRSSRRSSRRSEP